MEHHRLVGQTIRRDLKFPVHGETSQNNGFDPSGNTEKINEKYLQPCGKHGKNNGLDVHMEENHVFNGVNIYPNDGFDVHPFCKTEDNKVDLHPCARTGENKGFYIHPFVKTKQNVENNHTSSKRLHADILFSRKRPRLSPLFCGNILQAYSRRNYLDRNRISELPDDILLHILSFLTIKEAGKTDVLSRRWRHLWSHVSTLNFNSDNISHEVSVAQKVIEVDTLRYKSIQLDKHTYIHWVDQVVSLHRAPIIGEFRVQCELQKDSRKSIDEWVRFAMNKRLRMFGMDMSLNHGAQYRHYTFAISSFSISLASLELSGVNVTGGTLEAFLQNCPVLEFLSVRDSPTLVDLRVVGQSLNLKYLIIYYCDEMKHLEISAPNLVYVNYFGPIVSMPFKTNPKLSEISLGGSYAVDLTNNVMEHLSYLSQLETLTLILPCILTDAMMSVRLPEWTRLKKLVVQVSTYPSFDLRCMKSLLKACPYLNIVVFQLDYDINVRAERLSGRRWQTCDDAHYHLKIVRIVGLNGTAGLELALYLMDISVSLEKIIADSRYPANIRNPRAFVSCNAKRTRAKQLGKYLKPGADLVIL